MSNIQAQQAQFMVFAQQRLHTLKDVMRQKQMNAETKLYYDLVLEEFKELQVAFDAYGKAVQEDEKLACLCDVADAVGDCAVVLMGLCNATGIPFHDVYQEIHRSNMTKFVQTEQGPRLLKRVDGKVVKPAGWIKPNLMNILKYKLVMGE